jgi:hypothetical protein
MKEKIAVSAATPAIGVKDSLIFKKEGLMLLLRGDDGWLTKLPGPEEGVGAKYSIDDEGITDVVARKLLRSNCAAVT